MNKTTFTKRKFLKLDFKQRHKHCAAILRSIYETILQKKAEENVLFFQKYNDFLNWLDENPFEKTEDLKKISQQYHWHLAQANILLNEHNLLPHIRKGDHIPKTDFLPIGIFLDDLRSAYNVGSILRTTEALRIGKIFFGGKTPYIDNPKVKKTSMETSTIIDCKKEFSLDDLPKPWIVLDTSNDAVDVAKFIFPSTFTLILGNEEFGVSDFFLKHADAVIEVPLFGRKNSINVACAFSIAAAEIRRQNTYA